MPLFLAKLAQVGGGDAAADGAAGRIRCLETRGQGDWRRPERQRRLRSAYRSLHLAWERWADRRKNAASGRFLVRRYASL
jgi:hypothetical protein